ncbi:hypothetical protein HDU67_002221 [Dinochytrium kinnereticum]|nr:hypothetical protein HDU67_002221 [Dinochytrium kinnereticum]
MGAIPSAVGGSSGGMIPNPFTASRPENADVPSSNEVHEPKNEDHLKGDDQEATSNELASVTDEVKDDATEESKNNEDKPSTSPFSFLSKAIPENVMGAIPSAVGSKLGGMIPNPFVASRPENADVPSANEVEEPKKEDDVKGDDQQPTSNERALVTDEAKDDAAKKSKKNEEKPSTSPFSFLSKAIPQNVMGGIPSAVDSSLGGMIPNPFAATPPESADVPSANEVQEPKNEDDVKGDDQQPTSNERASVDDQEPTSNERALVTDEVKDEATEASTTNEDKPSTSPFSFLSKAIPENVMGAIPSAVGSSLGGMIPNPFTASRPEDNNVSSSNEVHEPKNEDDVKGDDQQPSSNERALGTDEVKDDATEASTKNEDKPSTSPFSFLSKAIPENVMGAIPSSMSSSLGGIIPNPFTGSPPENAHLTLSNDVNDPETPMVLGDEDGSVRSNSPECLEDSNRVNGKPFSENSDTAKEARGELFASQSIVNEDEEAFSEEPIASCVAAEDVEVIPSRELPVVYETVSDTVEELASSEAVATVETSNEEVETLSSEADVTSKDSNEEKETSEGHAPNDDTAELVPEQPVFTYDMTKEEEDLSDELSVSYPENEKPAESTNVSAPTILENRIDAIEKRFEPEMTHPNASGPDPVKEVSEDEDEIFSEEPSAFHKAFEEKDAILEDPLAIDEPSLDEVSGLDLGQPGESASKPRVKTQGFEEDVPQETATSPTAAEEVEDVASKEPDAISIQVDNVGHSEYDSVPEEPTEETIVPELRLESLSPIAIQAPNNIEEVSDDSAIGDELDEEPSFPIVNEKVEDAFADESGVISKEVNNTVHTGPSSAQDECIEDKTQKVLSEAPFIFQASDDEDVSEETSSMDELTEEPVIPIYLEKTRDASAEEPDVGAEEVDHGVYREFSEAPKKANEEAEELTSQAPFTFQAPNGEQEVCEEPAVTNELLEEPTIPKEAEQIPTEKISIFPNEERGVDEDFDYHSEPIQETQELVPQSLSTFQVQGEVEDASDELISAKEFTEEPFISVAPEAPEDAEDASTAEFDASFGDLNDIVRTDPDVTSEELVEVREGVLSDPLVTHHTSSDNEATAEKPAIVKGYNEGEKILPEAQTTGYVESISLEEPSTSRESIGEDGEDAVPSQPAATLKNPLQEEQSSKPASIYQAPVEELDDTEEPACTKKIVNVHEDTWPALDVNDQGSDSEFNIEVEEKEESAPTPQEIVKESSVEEDIEGSKEPAANEIAGESEWAYADEPTGYSSGKTEDDIIVVSDNRAIDSTPMTSQGEDAMISAPTIIDTQSLFSKVNPQRMFGALPSGFRGMFSNPFTKSATKDVDVISPEKIKEELGFDPIPNEVNIKETIQQDDRNDHQRSIIAEELKAPLRDIVAPSDVDVEAVIDDRSVDSTPEPSKDGETNIGASKIHDAQSTPARSQPNSISGPLPARVSNPFMALSDTTAPETIEDSMVESVPADADLEEPICQNDVKANDSDETQQQTIPFDDIIQEPKYAENQPNLPAPDVLSIMKPERVLKILPSGQSSSLGGMLGNPLTKLKNSFIPSKADDCEIKSSPTFGNEIYQEREEHAVPETEVLHAENTILEPTEALHEADWEIPKGAEVDQSPILEEIAKVVDNWKASEPTALPKKLEDEPENVLPEIVETVPEQSVGLNNENLPVGDVVASDMMNAEPALIDKAVTEEEVEASLEDTVAPIVIARDTAYAISPEGSIVDDFGEQPISERVDIEPEQYSATGPIQIPVEDPEEASRVDNSIKEEMEAAESDASTEFKADKRLQTHNSIALETELEEKTLSKLHVDNESSSPIEVRKPEDVLLRLYESTIPEEAVGQETEKAASEDLSIAREVAGDAAGNTALGTGTIAVEEISNDLSPSLSEAFSGKEVDAVSEEDVVTSGTVLEEAKEAHDPSITNGVREEIAHIVPTAVTDVEYNNVTLRVPAIADESYDKVVETFPDVPNVTYDIAEGGEDNTPEETFARYTVLDEEPKEPNHENLDIPRDAGEDQQPSIAPHAPTSSALNIAVEPKNDNFEAVLGDRDIEPTMEISPIDVNEDIEAKEPKDIESEPSSHLFPKLSAANVVGSLKSGLTSTFGGISWNPFKKAEDAITPPEGAEAAIDSVPFTVEVENHDDLIGGTHQSVDESPSQIATSPALLDTSVDLNHENFRGIESIADTAEKHTNTISLIPTFSGLNRKSSESAPLRVISSIDGVLPNSFTVPNGKEVATINGPSVEDSVNAMPLTIAYDETLLHPENADALIKPEVRGPSDGTSTVVKTSPDLAAPEHIPSVAEEFDADLGFSIPPLVINEAVEIHLPPISEEVTKVIDSQEFVDEPVILPNKIGNEPENILPESVKPLIKREEEVEKSLPNIPGDIDMDEDAIKSGKVDMGDKVLLGEVSLRHEEEVAAIDSILEEAEGILEEADSTASSENISEDEIRDNLSPEGPAATSQPQAGTEASLLDPRNVREQHKEVILPAKPMDQAEETDVDAPEESSLTFDISGGENEPALAVEESLHEMEQLPSETVLTCLDSAEDEIELIPEKPLTTSEAAMELEISLPSSTRNVVDEEGEELLEKDLAETYEVSIEELEGILAEDFTEEAASIDRVEAVSSYDPTAKEIEELSPQNDAVNPYQTKEFANVNEDREEKVAVEMVVPYEKPLDIIEYRRKDVEELSPIGRFIVDDVAISEAKDIIPEAAVIIDSIDEEKAAFDKVDPISGETREELEERFLRRPSITYRITDIPEKPAVTSEVAAELRGDIEPEEHKVHAVMTPHEEVEAIDIVKSAITTDDTDSMYPIYDVGKVAKEILPKEPDATDEPKETIYPECATPIDSNPTLIVVPPNSEDSTVEGREELEEAEEYHPAIEAVKYMPVVTYNRQESEQANSKEEMMQNMPIEPTLPLELKEASLARPVDTATIDHRREEEATPKATFSNLLERAFALKPFELTRKKPVPVDGRIPTNLATIEDSSLDAKSLASPTKKPEEISTSFTDLSEPSATHQEFEYALPLAPKTKAVQNDAEKSLPSVPNLSDALELAPIKTSPEKGLSNLIDSEALNNVDAVEAVMPSKIISDESNMKEEMDKVVPAAFKEFAQPSIIRVPVIASESLNAPSKAPVEEAVFESVANRIRLFELQQPIANQSPMRVVRPAAEILERPMSQESSTLDDVTEDSKPRGPPIFNKFAWGNIPTRLDSNVGKDIYPEEILSADTATSGAPSELLYSPTVEIVKSVDVLEDVQPLPEAQHRQETDEFFEDAPMYESKVDRAAFTPDVAIMSVSDRLFEALPPNPTSQTNQKPGEYQKKKYYPAKAPDMEATKEALVPEKLVEVVPEVQTSHADQEPDEYLTDAPSDYVDRSSGDELYVSANESRDVSIRGRLEEAFPEFETSQIDQEPDEYINDAPSESLYPPTIDEADMPTFELAKEEAESLHNAQPSEQRLDPDQYLDDALAEFATAQPDSEIIPKTVHRSTSNLSIQDITAHASQLTSELRARRSMTSLQDVTGTQKVSVAPLEVAPQNITKVAPQHVVHNEASVMTPEPQVRPSGASRSARSSSLTSRRGRWMWVRYFTTYEVEGERGQAPNEVVGVPKEFQGEPEVPTGGRMVVSEDYSMARPPRPSKGPGLLYWIKQWFKNLEGPSLSTGRSHSAPPRPIKPIEESLPPASPVHPVSYSLDQGRESMDREKLKGKKPGPRRKQPRSMRSSEPSSSASVDYGARPSTSSWIDKLVTGIQTRSRSWSRDASPRRMRRRAATPAMDERSKTSFDPDTLESRLVSMSAGAAPVESVERPVSPEMPVPVVVGDSLSLSPISHPSLHSQKSADTSASSRQAYRPSECVDCAGTQFLPGGMVCQRCISSPGSGMLYPMELAQGEEVERRGSLASARGGPLEGRDRVWDGGLPSKPSSASTFSSMMSDSLKRRKAASEVIPPSRGNFTTVEIPREDVEERGRRRPRMFFGKLGSGKQQTKDKKKGGPSPLSEKGKPHQEAYRAPSTSSLRSMIVLGSRPSSPSRQDETSSRSPCDGVLTAIARALQNHSPRSERHDTDDEEDNLPPLAPFSNSRRAQSIEARRQGSGRASVSPSGTVVCHPEMRESASRGGTPPLIAGGTVSHPSSFPKPSLSGEARMGPSGSAYTEAVAFAGRHEVLSSDEDDVVPLGAIRMAHQPGVNSPSSPIPPTVGRFTPSPSRTRRKEFQPGTASPSAGSYSPRQDIQPRVASPSPVLRTTDRFSPSPARAPKDVVLPPVQADDSPSLPGSIPRSYASRAPSAALSRSPAPSTAASSKPSLFSKFRSIGKKQPKRSSSPVTVRAKSPVRTADATTTTITRQTLDPGPQSSWIRETRRSSSLTRMDEANWKRWSNTFAAAARGDLDNVDDGMTVPFPSVERGRRKSRGGKSQGGGRRARNAEVADVDDGVSTTSSGGASEVVARLVEEASKRLGLER